MQGTGLDSPLWIANWGRTLSRVRLPPFTIPALTIKLPTLDREDKIWLAALAGLVAAFTFAATGPWG